MHYLATTILSLSVVFSTVTRPAYSQVSAKEDSLLKAKKHFSFAVQYKKSESYELARKNYLESIAYNDTVYQVHYSYGDLLIKMNRPHEARHEFARSLDLNPEHYNSASMLARLCYEAADYDSALAAFELMYRLKPDDHQALRNIASLREHLGMKRKALEAYTALAESGKADTDILERASGIAAELGEWKTSLQFTTLMLEDSPDDTELLRRGAQACLELGDPKEALVHAEELASLGETDIVILERIEQLALRIGDTETRINALTLHNAADRRNTGITAELAENLLVRGKQELAAEYIAKGLEIKPDDGRLRILMGNYYHKRGENDKAIAEYEAALKDERWKDDAQQFIWQIRPPASEDEKAEREFFERGREAQDPE